ncbi:LLM class flavin-dependent oxidoreductase [Corynebacterium pacaense]|uniref:LLM class flavin-dependent oxidoreductase n=1 Tax=Corynebacterium pacaense TaxID=1816684 RepID=UPI0009B9E28B|nr:LLM class flavin-dependent oxidoreductase [Corynebacterium pacaense]
MKAFGFLSFGHYQIGHEREMLHQALDLAREADSIGVNGAYFRVHHFAPQNASPMPLLGAVIGATKHIEVGTGVIDMRYENPLYLAEEAAALNLLADGRVALGVSRGSPEPADKGWEAFGYNGGDDPRAAEMARKKFLRFLDAIDGEGMAVAADSQYPRMYRPGAALPIFPHDPELRKSIWWGAGSRNTAEQAARDGVNLMSSTLLTEATGQSLGDLQYDQIQRYRSTWKESGHDWTPRVSVSRTVFPIVTDRDRELFGLQGQSEDQIGIIDDTRSTFGRSYVGSPDELIDQLRADAAVMDADTLMLTIPNQLGVEINASILRNFAEHVAPALGWKPNWEGKVEGSTV